MDTILEVTLLQPYQDGHYQCYAQPIPCLVQFHVWEVLGIEDAQAKEGHVTIKKLENTRRGVAALNSKVLNHSRISVLKVLCTENGINISTARKLKKKKTSYSIFDGKCSECSPSKLLTSIGMGVLSKYSTASSFRQACSIARPQERGFDWWRIFWKIRRWTPRAPCFHWQDHKTQIGKAAARY